MDISNLKKKYPLLIDHLQSSGYDKSYIECIRFVIKDILKHASELVSYQDYLDSVRPKYKPATYERKVSAINMIELFEKYGVLPALNSKVNFWKQHKYESLSDDYRSVIDTYREVAISRRICKTSIEGFVLTGVNFCVYLQSCGSTTLDDIQEEDVLNYFYDSPSETIIRGYDLLYKIKRILKASQTKHVSNLRVIQFLPIIRKRTHVYQALKEDEIEILKTFLLDESSQISHRDRAILTIALYTGMRGGDIMSLTFSDIDWKMNIITLNQRKTGASLSIPLRPVVGNAIWNYVTLERPPSVYQNIFLLANKINAPITPAAIRSITVPVFKKLGIRRDGGTTGLYLFRHNMVISLLGKGIEAPVLSSILGHESPESLTPYLGADLTSLKRCALGLEDFPVRKGVFDV